MSTVAPSACPRHRFAATAVRRRGARTRARRLRRDEAALLDAGRFDDWLALFADDGRYWVPLQGARAGRPGRAQLARLRGPPAAAAARRAAEESARAFAASAQPLPARAAALGARRCRRSRQRRSRLRTPFVYVEARGGEQLLLAGSVPPPAGRHRWGLEDPAEARRPAGCRAAAAGDPAVHLKRRTADVSVRGSWLINSVCGHGHGFGSGRSRDWSARRGAGRRQASLHCGGRRARGDSPALLDPRSHRGTRCVRFAHCAQTAAMSQTTKRVLRTRRPRACAARRRRGAAPAAHPHLCVIRGGGSGGTHAGSPQRRGRVAGRAPLRRRGAQGPGVAHRRKARRRAQPV